MRVFIVLVAMLIGHAARADHVYLREADAPHALFPTATNAERKTLELSAPELETLGKALGRHIDARTYPYLEVRGEHETLGTIFLLDVIGQAQPITFAVAIGPEGAVQDVRVMVYRESHGDEIEDRRFRKQFVNKTLKDPITLGKDIDAITGATISSRSETFAVRKGLALWEILHHHADRTSRSP
jgi:Na+-translocating ferredoxin:NAD+ oxidoreductase RnfG subunit